MASVPRPLVASNMDNTNRIRLIRLNVARARRANWDAMAGDASRKAEELSGRNWYMTEARTHLAKLDRMLRGDGIMAAHLKQREPAVVLSGRHEELEWDIVK